MDLSVVIPVYGSQDTLRPLVDRLRTVLSQLDRSWELVFIDDCGPDRASDILLELYQHDPEHIVVVQLMRNFGQHNALMCGFHQARGRYIITIDDDLQNPPEEIPRLLKAIETEGLDLVYGTITGEKQHHPIRNLGSWLINKFGQYVFQSKIKGSSYRIMRAELVQSILNYDLNFTYIDGLLAWCTQRVGAIPVTHGERGAGRSGYSARKLLTMALNLFTNFSLFPLQVVAVLGIFFSAVGFLLGGYFIVLSLMGYITVPGYASVIVAVLIMGGAQLLSLGVMGEYIGRILLNINRKPQFVVRKTFKGNEPDRKMHE